VARDEQEGEDDRWAGAPLPPEDRVWRHPSELASGMPAPAAWVAPASPGRRPLLALAGACLTGAALACGALWLTRPTWVSETTSAPPRAAASISPPSTVASYAAAGVPTVALADALAPHLVAVQAQVDGTWRSGTGVRLADANAILVAAPLVEGAGFIAVTVGGRRTGATLAGTDPATGTAIVVLASAATSSFPTDRALLASPTRAGEAVAVVGVRAGEDGSDDQRVVPTSVSATGLRASVGDLVLHDALQLDRTLPADALGAVVVDASGHLVGVVVATGDADGMAVAVPGRAALVAAADLLDDGEVRRAWLGVEAADVDPATATVLDIAGGALVTSVQGSSPAAAAGLRSGDVITRIGELEVDDASDLVLAIQAGRPGEELEVRWQRGADAQEASVTLGG
jgi:putative serine protease PepD